MAKIILQNIDNAFSDLQQFILCIDLLTSDERIALAHRLHEIYKQQPEHKEWLQKLHEFLDID